MGTPSSFDYAVLRVVPRVERQEFLNAGVVLFSLEKRFLSAKVAVDERRLRGLWPELDMDSVRRHLNAFSAICKGEAAGGLIGSLPMRERFHWLVAPRSTMIQVSPVHSGLSESPADALDDLFERLVSTSDRSGNR